MILGIQGRALWGRRDDPVVPAAGRHRRVPRDAARFAGLWRVLRALEARPWRALGVAYLVLALPLGVVAGDKPYYVAALYLPLTGAGGGAFRAVVGAEREAGAPGGTAGDPRGAHGRGDPIVLPVLPASIPTDVPLQEVNCDLGEQISWRDVAAHLEDAWVRIPAEERGTAMVLTGNYGEAGAIEPFGGGPPDPVQRSQHVVVVAHAPEGTATVLVVGLSEGSLSPFFGELERVGALDNGLGVQTEEQGVPIWMARDPRQPLPAMWEELRHYGRRMFGRFGSCVHGAMEAHPIRVEPIRDVWMSRASRSRSSPPPKGSAVPGSPPAHGERAGGRVCHARSLPEASRALGSARSRSRRPGLPLPNGDERVLGKIPTTRVRRLISLCSRSSGFVECSLRRCFRGKCRWARRSSAASSKSSAAAGNRSESIRTTSCSLAIA